MRRHFVSIMAISILEHKRFRSIVSGTLIAGVLLVQPSVSGMFEDSQVFSQSDFRANVGASEEVTLTTRKTSRLPVEGPLSQGFTYYHPGIDLEKGFNEPVHPFLPGFVVETGYQGGGYGNYILIDHRNGYASLYAHLNIIKVKKDDEVFFDSVIGTIGLTGKTTGSHVHLEIFEDGKAINPLTVLPDIALASGSSNSKAFVGGPQVHPTRVLTLPINQMPPASYINHDLSSKGKDEKDDNKAKPASLGIWLPDGLTLRAQKQAGEKADSKGSHQLPKLPDF